VRFVEHDQWMARRMIEDVALAVTEACTNVVRHAYPAGSGELRVRAWREPHVVVVVVSDDGVGVDHPSANKGLGMGRRLIAELAHAETRCQDGTEVEMRFPCWPAGMLHAGPIASL
jgi:two-component sensor histidine kinase